MAITEQLLLNHGSKKKLEEIETLTLNDANLTNDDLAGAHKFWCLKGFSKIILTNF